MKIKLCIAIIAILWVGMIIAIGMESIVKFSAASLAKPVGFDVGRVVFSAFNKVQVGLLIVLLIAMTLTALNLVDKILIYAVAGILLLQIFWLFPELSQRVDLILAGSKPSPTYKHGLYGILELIKLTLLFALGLRLIFAYNA